MILVIETATAACSVALLGDDLALIDEAHEEVGRGHAERLLPMIEALLAGRRPDRLLVDCGPGSFTGLRVGLAAAHGLAIGWAIPVAGFSSTALLATMSGERTIAVALEAGHGQLFVQNYGGDPLAPLDPLQSLTPDLAGAFVQGDIVTGNGADRLIAARGHGISLPALPRASNAALLPPALRSLPPQPIYGRAPDAKPMNPVP